MNGTTLRKPATANPVVVVEYDWRWPELFESLRTRVTAVLGEMAARVEHVGSTAVPGLAAKPVIDIDVLLRSDEVLFAAIERLARLGYVHRGNLGVPEREAFATPANDPPHHLYVCPPQSAEFRRHVAFRDYLRLHTKEAKAYAELKIALAGRFREDRVAYNEGKTEFVAGILARVGTNF